MSEAEQNCNTESTNNEFYIPKHLQCHQIIEILRDCPCSKTEYLDNFIKPNLKQPVLTRSEKMEQLFMKEMYEEYVNAKNRPPDVVKPETVTEYIASFSRDYNQEEVNELIQRYPLYGNNTITCYNKTGNPLNSFKKKVTITRSVAEQDTQFG